MSELITRRPSTRNLEALPGPEQLEKLSMSLAMLDAIVLPDEWDGRYYSFNKEWDAAKGLRMGSMRNGIGDYEMAHPGSPPSGVLTEFPKSIDDFLAEPAFKMEDTTLLHLAATWKRMDGRKNLLP